MRSYWEPRRGIVKTLLLAVMIMAGCSDRAVANESQRLNVLLIVTDDMNNDLGCYGHPRVKSPHIDRLAQRGMRFDRAYCQVTLCNPSRVSMLSGLRPDKTKVYTLSEKTRSSLGDWVMLPEYFRNQGYFTAQIGKIYHTKDGYEDPRSWDIEIREFGKRPPNDQIIRSGRPDGPGEHTTDWSSLRTPDDQTPDGIVARRAAKIMAEAVEQGKPFFVGAGFRRPHAPFAAPKQYFDLYPLETIDLPTAVPSGYYESLPAAAINYPAPAEPLTEQQQRELIASYYACNSFVDSQVGVLLDAVDELDLWDNTVIVFVSDHGYHLGDHGGFWHKLSLFEESARVPLIVYAPAMQATGQATEQLVELIDLYPTLVALAGLPDRDRLPVDSAILADTKLDGINFGPLLDDPTRETKPAAYSMASRSDQPEADHAKHLSYLGRSVRTANWRYTEWDQGHRGVELYDHRNDPRELVNLADQPEHASRRKDLQKLIAAEPR